MITKAIKNWYRNFRNLDSVRHLEYSKKRNSELNNCIDRLHREIMDLVYKTHGPAGTAMNNEVYKNIQEMLDQSFNGTDELDITDPNPVIRYGLDDFRWQPVSNDVKYRLYKCGIIYPRDYNQGK